MSHVVPRHRFQESALSKESRLRDPPSYIRRVFRLEPPLQSPILEPVGERVIVIIIPCFNSTTHEMK
jgi:hypothetical protein